MAPEEPKPSILVDNWVLVKEKPDLFDLWRPIINLNRHLGIVLLQPIDNAPYFKHQLRSFRLINSAVVVFIFSYLLVLAIISFQNQFTHSILSEVLVDLVTDLIYLIHCQFTIGFFLNRGKRLVDLFQNWTKTERSLKNKRIYQPVGNSYKYYFTLLFVLLLAENVIRLLSDLFQVLYGVESVWGKKPIIIASDYYLPQCNIFTRIVFLLSEIIGVYLWFMGDVIIVSSSIILNNYFECLQQHMKKRRSNCTEQEVEEYRVVYLLIADLVCQVDAIFSPLVLVTIGLNLAYILTTFYHGLASSTSKSTLPITYISSYFTCGYIVIRSTISTSLAARLSERANQTDECLYHLALMNIESNDQKLRAMIKMDILSEQIRSNPLGLGGCGFFTISKSSMATLFSLILTYEVILLQWSRMTSK